MGAIEPRLPHPLFDSVYYLRSNPDVARTGVNPLWHYLVRGGFEGRDPCLDFNSAAYLRAYPDVAAAGINPLVDYVLRGADPGRIPSSPDALVGNEETWREDYVRLRNETNSAHQARADAATMLPHFPKVGDEESVERARQLALAIQAAPRVSIVITAHGNLARTVECLEVIGANTPEPAFEVIVVGDVAMATDLTILEMVPGLRCHWLESGESLLHALTSAAAKARGGTLVFLDDDVRVVRGWLTALLSSLADPEVAAAGPKVTLPDGRLLEAGSLVEHDGSLRRIGTMQGRDDPAFTIDREVDDCSAACLAVDRERFLALGGFSDSYSSARYGAVDLCLRLREDGGRVVSVPAPVAVLRDAGDAPPMLDGPTDRQALVEAHPGLVDELGKTRVVAFYLPQFHPIPENDRWWGKGFTEWRNVVKARPNFIGHYQPRFPADLGFYDLRVDDVMDQQWALARRYGIGAFCYYFYWFSGQRLLEKPLERLTQLATKLPYCLAWANENWTRNWDGGDGSVLLAQGHGHQDDARLIDDLMPHFGDPAYLRVHGRPLFLVYRHGLMIEARRTLDSWRESCLKAGLAEPYLAACETFGFGVNDEDPRDAGFDASVEFPPHNLWCGIGRPRITLNPAFRHDVFDYRQMAVHYARRTVPAFPRFKTAMVGFDNTPRRQDDASIYVNASPGALQAWLQSIIERTQETRYGDERLVFINAWNEWAEGNYLEPDQAYGHAYLEAVQNALNATLLAGSPR